MRVPKKNDDEEDHLSLELGWKAMKAQAKGRLPTLCVTGVALAFLLVLLLK